jgi:hypothetical protein
MCQDMIVGQIRIKDGRDYKIQRFYHPDTNHFSRLARTASVMPFSGRMEGITS